MLDTSAAERTGCRLMTLTTLSRLSGILKRASQMLMLKGMTT